ncbi:hypothetical protein PIB30_101713 [Stylosanthes scabra]|uniref:Uncharacterized protein n=1 Tax=Stylosanthes scabra TaxID=79078 RepID=A0ABU6VWQ4_9FABA|nr:hypothetical protein [Stylosanthes scabra]
MPLRTDQNVSMMFSYHRGISSVFAIELCVQLQDVGGSCSSSNHVESGRGININEGARIPPNRRASSPSPSFSPYVNRLGNRRDKTTIEFDPEIEKTLKRNRSRVKA